jgi:hypothetical protein
MNTPENPYKQFSTFLSYIKYGKNRRSSTQTEEEILSPRFRLHAHFQSPAFHTDDDRLFPESDISP